MNQMKLKHYYILNQLVKMN